MGLSLTETGRHLGVSPSAIAKSLYRLYKHKSNWSRMSNKAMKARRLGSEDAVRLGREEEEMRCQGSGDRLSFLKETQKVEKKIEKIEKTQIVKDENRFYA